jgi:16S rRNA (cytidine1402-2'-O)-methyltransferase
MTQEGGFVFAGFLPTKAAERERAVLLLAAEPRAVVLLEAPHRIEALAGALAALGERPVTFGRELTKQFEDIVTLPAMRRPGLAGGAMPTACAANSSWCCTARAVAADAGDDQRVLKLLLAELPLKTAVKLAAEITGSSKNTLYDAALALKKSADGAKNS